jgi:hypothetical protein
LWPFFHLANAKFGSFLYHKHLSGSQQESSQLGVFLLLDRLDREKFTLLEIVMIVGLAFNGE